MTGTRRSYGRRWFDSVRHPARRDGAVVWALLVLPWVAGLVLARRHHLDVGGWTVALTVSLGLSTLWVTWATFRDASKSEACDSASDILRIADELAGAVGRQWAREAAVRRLNDPYPLSVSWMASAEDLATPWDSLTELAASGVGWPPSAPGRSWASGPDELAGKGGELGEVLEKVPTGRLVVLGEPGSGKTMLMIRLVLDLLAARATGGPVPVLFPVASWDPVGQDLRDWMATRLITDYPALAGPPPAGEGGPTRAAALIEAGLIVPVLDGLDELPGSVRSAAISKVNDALQPGGHVVLTCRTRHYRDAVRPPDGLEAVLSGAAVIELDPLDAGVVRRYLRDDAPGPVGRARWDPVLTLLGTQDPAGRALSTPLMVALARTIYNPRPGEASGTLRDPAELCGLSDRAAVEAHLFDAFIPAVYLTSAKGRWTAGQAERWLAFLARHLELTIGTSDLAWWQLEKALSCSALRLAVALLSWLGVWVVSGLVFGLGTGVGVAVWVGGGLGLVAGLGAVISAAAGPDQPARGVRISTASLIGGLVAGLGIGLLTGLGIELEEGFGAEVVGGVGAGIGVGVVGGLVAGLTGVPSEIAEAVDPRTVLARDRQVLLFLALGAGIVAGLGAGVVAGLGAGVVAGVGTGLSIGLMTGLAAGLGLTRWVSYTLARGWLAFRGQLPWLLMTFLEDAHQRGVLRQAGATYQFRHLELQRRLAARP